MPEGERRLAAIIFTDMVGFSSLSQRNEALSLDLLKEQRAIVRSSIQKHKGKEIKTIGDAFLVEFASALEAVRVAFDIQQSLHEINQGRPPERRILLRAGIHLGDVIMDQGDIYGDTVNIASRIEPLAEPGGICVSEQVYDHVKNKFEFPFSSLGKKQLKNIEEPLEVYRVVLPWEKEIGESKSNLDTRRVAVLPFSNMSPDPADEYFADGMTEELITSLSGVKSLTVIARTSVMRYKNAARPISEIGRELNSGSLIEGSVRKASGKVRITVQLIDARNEGHLWAQAYDRQLEDIFGIQSEIAEKVVKELKAQLVDSEKQRIEKRPTTSTEAYTLYLKARHYWNERSKEGLGRAIEYFTRAIEIDPRFALGYSGLADCYSIMAHNSLGETAPNYEKAKEYASKALELDGGLAEAHAGLAIILTDYERDWKSAESELKKAIELKPNYSSAHQWYAIALGEQGRLDEATKQIKTALSLDPFSLIINVNVGDSLYYDGQFEEAIAQFNKVVEMDPNFPPVYPSLTQAYMHVKRFDEAFQSAEKYGALTKRPSWIKLARAYVFAAMGKREQAIKLLKEAEEEGYNSENLSPYQFALVFFLMGDDEQGFSWLERAYAEHDGTLANMKIDFEFEKLRDDPRYIAMLQKLGLTG